MLTFKTLTKPSAPGRYYLPLLLLTLSFTAIRAQTNPSQLVFRATHQQADNLLYWITTGEENTKQFIIERSDDGTAYAALTTVTAKGSGNNRYTYTDKETSTSSYFYRLQVSDKSGNSSYSTVVQLDGAAPARISAYPNPTHNGVTVELVDNSLLNTTAKIYAASGRLVDEVMIRSLKQYIDVKHCPKGVLTIRLQNGKAISVVKE